MTIKEAFEIAAIDCQRYALFPNVKKRMCELLHMNYDQLNEVLTEEIVEDLFED
jgi:hypothetical protein